MHKIICSLLQFHGAQLGSHGLCLLAGGLFALLGVDRLEHFCYNFDFGFRHNRENIAVEMHRAALLLGVQEHLAHGLQHSLGSFQNLTEIILIHGNCHQNGYIFVLSAPVAAQVDTVHVDVWIAPAL